jgi:hypothetical protein
VHRPAVDKLVVVEGAEVDRQVVVEEVVADRQVVVEVVDRQVVVEEVVADKLVVVEVLLGERVAVGLLPMCRILYKIDHPRVFANRI